MDPATVRLHEMLIRLMKGAVSAWEEWLAQRRGTPPYRGATSTQTTG